MHVRVPKWYSIMRYQIYYLCLLFLPGKGFTSEYEIQNFHKVFYVTQKNPFITQNILGRDGKPKYKFICMDYKQSENYVGEYGAFSGFYQCKLFSLIDGTEIFQPVADWGVTQTRARFFLSQIIGGCKEHSLYGHKREFLVRGIRVIINIHDFTPIKSPKSFWGNYAFKLKLDVINYPKATGDFSGYASEMCASDKEGVDNSGNLIDNPHIIREYAY